MGLKSDGGQVDLPGSGLAAAGGMLFFTLFWCGITSIFCCIAFIPLSRYAWVQARYASAPGRVTAFGAEKGQDDFPALAYEYTVDGRKYEGTRWRLAFAKSEDEVAPDFKVGQAVVVRYNPASPEEAVLEPPFPRLEFFLSLFLQPFILVGLGGIVALVAFPFGRMRIRRFLSRDLRPPCRIPGWGVLDGGQNQWTIRPRTSLLELAMPFVIGYGGTCFFAIFAVAFTGMGGGHNGSGFSPLIVGGAFGLAVAVGLVSLGFRWKRLRRRSSVTIDFRHGSVHLRGPDRDDSLALGQFEAWSLQMVDRPATVRQEGKPTVAPLLGLAKDGKVTPVHFFAHDDTAPYVAMKLARELAARTCKNVLELPVEAEGEPAPKSVSEAIQRSGRGGKRWSEYADLM